MLTAQRSDAFAAAAALFSGYKRPPVVLEPAQFQTIVTAAGGDQDRALLSLANFIAYSGTSVDSGGHRIPRHGPPPAATHTVISAYPVGACVLGASGSVYLGANYEFYSPLEMTVHGEQCAVHNAAVHGEKVLLKLAVNAAPCGMCRQFLIELGDPQKLRVVFCSEDHNGSIIAAPLVRRRSCLFRHCPDDHRPSTPTHPFSHC